VPHPGSASVAPRRMSVVDEDRIVGSAKEIKGSVKETIGNATGDAKLRSDGRADQVEGKIQNAIGGVKDVVRDALEGIAALFQVRSQ
jgi:uncharacterized protein YjbJ (UPF0337 family)